MPLNRSYGGYSNSYGSSSYSNYSSFPKYSSGYASTYGLRSGSSSPALVRSSTPSYREPYSYNSSIINSVVPEEKKVDTRPSTGYTRYTTDYYSPYSRSYLYTSEAEKRELKTIKTEEIDTTDARKTGRDYAIPGEITRDTTVNLPRGKAVVRMVTQKLKENPYLSTLILDKENDPKKLTLGQRLALKYQIKEKPKPKPPTPPKPDSGEESEWTWESCSSSDEESTVPKSSFKKDSPVSKKESPPVSEKKSPVKKKSPTPPKYVSSVLAQARAITQKYTRSNTTTICSAEEPSAPKPEGRSSANKWLEALNADTKPRTQQNTTRIPNFGKAVAMNRSLLGNKLQEEQSKVESPTLQVRSSNSRPLSWAGNLYSLDKKPEENNNYSRDIRSVSRDTSSTSKEPLGSSSKSTSYSSYSKEPVSYSRYSSIPREPASYITTESMSPVKKSTKKESDSSSTSSSSPPLYKYRKPQRYKGAGSQYMYSSDEESPRDSLNLGWRKGQPPRGDVVVKLGNNKNKSVIEPVHSKSTLGRSSYTNTSTSDTTASTEAASTVAVSSAAAAAVSSVISSRVPASLQDRYQIPGLFIKPSTKTQPTSVKPVASKSGVNLPVSKTAPTKEVSDEESEWEYYTETETSDSDKNDEETKNIKTKVDTASSFLDKKAGLNSSQAGSIELPDSKLPAYKAPPVKVNLEITQVPVHQKQNITLLSKPEKIQEKVEKIYISPISTKPGIDNPKDSNQHSDLETQVKPDGNTKSTANSSRLILDVKETGINRDDKISKSKITKPLSSAPTVENDHELNQTKINSLSSPAKPHTREQDEKVHSISVDPMKKSLDQGSINVSTSKTKEKDSGKSPDKQTINVTSNKAKDKLIPQSSEQENLGAISKKTEHKVVEKKTDKVGNSKTPNFLENEPSSIISAKPKEKNTLKTGLQETTKVAKTKAEEKVPEKSNDKEFSKKTSSEKKEPSKAKKLAQEPIIVSPKKATEKNLDQEPSNITIENSVAKVPVTKSELDLLDIYTSKDKKQIPVKTETKDPEINTESKLVKKVKTKTEPVSSKQVVDVKEDIIKPEAVTPSDAPKQQEKVKRNAIDLKGVTAKPDSYLLEPKSGPGESRRGGQDMLSEGSDSCRTSTTASRELSPTNGFTPTTSLERLPPSLANLFSQTPTQSSYTDTEDENERPSWFNNAPVQDTDHVNPMSALNAMKADTAAQKTYVDKQEKKLIKVSKAAENPWYDDDEDDMRELLKNRPTILQEVDRDQNRRLTVEENMAVVKMYGGVMFPAGDMINTPKSLLYKVRNKDSVQPSSNRCSASSSISSVPCSPVYLSEDEEEELSQDYLTINGNQRNLDVSRPGFRKYGVYDFRFLKVLGKGSFGKVLLAQLRETNNFYALKALRKDVVLEDDDIECTLIERKVLALGVKHPFLCHLFCTFQTDSHLFFVMEYLNGGDLMFHIQQEGRFSVERARFYSAEIVCALKFLHKKGIVYRDLKLDNLLLDCDGHIRIVDFGMCKLQLYLDKTADTFCGTPDYMAPEIIKGMKYTHSVDWWSFGVLLYEMLIGQSPFNGCDEDELFWSICNEQAYFPRFLSAEAKYLLDALLEKNPSERLGVSESIHGDICKQPFFRTIDFIKLENKELNPPFKPQLRTPLDVSYFDTAFTEEPIKLTPVDSSLLRSLDQRQFKGFSLTNKLYTLK